MKNFLKKNWFKIKESLKTVHLDCVFCYVKNLSKKRPNIKFNKKTLIIVSLTILMIVGVSIGLYAQAKFSYLTKNIVEPLANTSFFAYISNYSYGAIWGKNFEMERLKQEAELSKLKEERANKLAQQEEIKRGEAEKAQKEAEEKAQQETIKRSRAEEKTKQEQTAKNLAEAKAKQEEFEKKLKEQQLSEKEAEEKRMNTDNDGDGLTYRRELELGTSDWNSDSDTDGIPDNLDTHPAGGGRNIAQTFSWSYGGYSWTYTENIQEDWYDYYKAKKPRPNPRGAEYVTYTDPFIQKISKKISDASKENGLDSVAMAQTFVQSLSYVDDVYTGYDEYPKYPVETFFEKNGDCEDTSYLSASIIRAMNIDTILILLPDHMAVGVALVNCNNPGTSYNLNNSCYYYAETTGDGWTLGNAPDKYRYTSATLITIPFGDKVSVYPTYKKPCVSSSDFLGYYTDGKDFYSDSQCNNLTYCLLYKGFYYNPLAQSFYHDSSCSQIVVQGCYKSTTYPGYFYNSVDFYSDSKCTQKAKICRSSSIYSDTYWDGDYNYWDNNCTQKVVSWCSKSTYHPGYFFNSLDYKYYYDYQCTQKADL